MPGRLIRYHAALDTPVVTATAERVATGESPIGGKLGRSLAAKHIPKLDALRAISAIFVMLFHFGLHFPPGFGVLCFFVISGFLITWLLLAEYEATGDVSLRGFYARRSLRIFPAFYVQWAIITLVMLLHHKFMKGPAFSALFYLSDYYVAFHPKPETGYTLSWSLSVEEQFYLLWPLLFLKVMPNRRRLLKVLTVIVGCIWIYRILIRLAGVSQAYAYNAFECRADAILVGCGLAIALRAGYFPGFWAMLCRHWLNLVVSISLLSFLLMVHVRGTYFRDMVGHAIEPLLIAVVIVQLLGIECRPLDLLDSRPLRFLGKISYSTYLYHGLFPMPSGVPSILKVIPAYTLATISYYCVEKPFLRLKDRWFKAPDPPPRSPALSRAAAAGMSTGSSSGL